MGIFKTEAVGVECDNCKKIYDDYDGVSFWVDETDAKEMAVCDDWTFVEDKCYCDKCYTFDENNNLIIKTLIKEKHICSNCKKQNELIVSNEHDLAIGYCEYCDHVIWRE